MGVVYKITNKINMKIYIGETLKTPLQRLKQHFRSAKNVKSHSYNSPFYNAIRKYGENVFFIEILGEYNTKEELHKKEIEFCEYFNAWSPFGYVLRAGEGPNTVSVETKEKHRKNKLGSLNPMFGKISPNRGKSISDETREKIKKARATQVFSQETIEKRASKLRGLKREKEVALRIGSTHAKTYTFISPNGEIISVTNLKKFCRETPGNLQSNHMCKVHSGKLPHHKGWKKYIPTIMEV